MPRVNPNNKNWLRGRRLNQKRHFEMTEEEKANVASCRGEKDKHVCKNPVFRCTQCRRRFRMPPVRRISDEDILSILDED